MISERTFIAKLKTQLESILEDKTQVLHFTKQLADLISLPKEFKYFKKRQPQIKQLLIEANDPLFYALLTASRKKLIDKKVSWDYFREKLILLIFNTCRLYGPENENQNAEIITAVDTMLDDIKNMLLDNNKPDSIIETCISILHILFSELPLTDTDKKELEASFTNLYDSNITRFDDQRAHIVHDEIIFLIQDRLRAQHSSYHRLFNNMLLTPERRQEALEINAKVSRYEY